MKKLIIHSTYFLAILFISLSCNKDILDLSPLDSVTDEAVFNSTDPGLMIAFVNNIYQGLPDGFNWGMIASVTDEAHMNAGSWAGMTSIMLSQLSPSNEASFSSSGYYSLYNWNNVYEKVRAANLFMSKIEASPVDVETKNVLKGEVYFLRAYLYHNLVAMYGGVPIISKAYTLDDDFTVARDSYADCVDYISGQCDSAAMLLPLEQADLGRATKGAALALKSRTLLYAASDLYNTSSNWSGYSNPELVSYTSGDRQTRWQEAKDAAKAVMDLGIYSLYAPNPADQTEAAENYYNLFISMGTSEDIFSRYYTANITGSWTTFNTTTFHNPCGYHGWGTEAPTQKMVDEYEMNDGTTFSWDNPDQAAAPYENREPRFYASILYDQAPWRTRPSDVSGDPYGKIQTGHFYADASTVKDGADTGGSNGGVDTWNSSWTGYYLKKTIDIAYDPVGNKQTSPWRFLRYTEVLLNYAEACIALGQEGEAKTYINMIRKRAGLPDINTSGTDLIKSLQHERQIELAFEELRYYDLRRWMIGEDAYANVDGIYIMYGSPTSFSPNYGEGTATYKVQQVDQRAWDPKSYFLPISKDEMNKNSKLIQNPGY